MKRKISVLLLITMLLGTVLFSCNNNSVDTPVDDTTIEDTTVEVVEDTTAEDTTVEDTTEEETTAEETTAEETTEEETTAEETTAEETTEEETTAEETTAEETTEEETTAEETTAEETTEEVTTEEETEEETTEEETEEETTEEVTTEEEEEELPTVLPTYTGNLNPRIINTVYPTKDVIIAEIDVVADGYGVDPTGVNDSTAGIQKAIDDVYKNGGGTVFLPVGQYRITKTITIRPYTTLHGDWCDPDLGKGYGTVILADVPSVDSRVSGLFNIRCASGVVGLTVYYPNQSLDNVLPYPFTFYIDGAPEQEFLSEFQYPGLYSNVYMMPTIRNTTVINGYRGIGANCNGMQKNPHEELNIENFHGTFLNVAGDIRNSSDVNTTDGVYISTKYWLDVSESYMAKPSASALKTYVKNNTTGFIFGDLEWAQFSNMHVDGCKVGIHVVAPTQDLNKENSPEYDYEFVGAMYDIYVTNCETGMIFDKQDVRWGTVIAGGQIDGGIVNNSQTYVKLTGVTVNGSTTGSIIVEGDKSVLSKIDYNKYYKKPVSKLYIASFSDNDSIGKELQALINEAGKTGGVVYIPAGIYELTTPIVVPAGVELRGATSVATRGHVGASKGTIILCHYGDKKGMGPDDEAQITLAGKSAGVNGLMLIYSSNRPGTNMDTSYTIRGKAEGVYVINTFIAGSAYGIDFRGCDNHFIKNVVTYCYYNTFLLGGKNGAIIGCLQNPTALLRTEIPGRVSFVPNATFNSTLVQPIARLQSHLITVEGAENQLIYNTFAYATANLIVNNNSTNTVVINLGADVVGDETAMAVMNGGSMTMFNTMRVYGHSYDLISGKLTMYNRTTIFVGSEPAVNESK